MIGTEHMQPAGIAFGFKGLELLFMSNDCSSHDDTKALGVGLLTDMQKGPLCSV